MITRPDTLGRDARLREDVPGACQTRAHGQREGLLEIWAPVSVLSPHRSRDTSYLSSTSPPQGVVEYTASFDSSVTVHGAQGTYLPPKTRLTTLLTPGTCGSPPHGTVLQHQPRQQFDAALMPT